MPPSKSSGSSSVRSVTLLLIRVFLVVTCIWNLTLILFCCFLCEFNVHELLAGGLVQRLFLFRRHPPAVGVWGSGAQRRSGGARDAGRGGRGEGHGPAPTTASASRAQSWPPALVAWGGPPDDGLGGPVISGAARPSPWEDSSDRGFHSVSAVVPLFTPRQPHPTHSTCLPLISASSGHRQMDGGP